MRSLTRAASLGSPSAFGAETRADTLRYRARRETQGGRVAIATTAVRGKDGAVVWARNWKWIVGLILILWIALARSGADANGKELTGLVPFLLETAGPVLVVWGIVESIQRRRARVAPSLLPPPVPAEAAPDRGRDAKECPSGHATSIGSRFCSQCGQPVASERAGPVELGHEDSGTAKWCPSCRMAVTVEGAWCPDCSGRLRWSGSAK